MTDIGGIHHTGLHVRDIERSIAFYRDLLGLQLVSRRKAQGDYTAEVLGYPQTHLMIAGLRHPSGGPILELVEYLEPAGIPVDTATPNAGTGHVCFTVSDIQATFARLKAAGVVFRSEGPVAITTGGLTGGQVMYFLDPDGIALELLQLPV